MNDKIKHIVNLVVACVLVFGLFAVCLIKPADEYSESERRPLDQAPVLNLENLSGGKFMTEFEEYTLDQFPLRDMFRTIKSFFAFYGMGLKTNNDLYLEDEYIAKQEYPYNPESVENAASIFNSIYNRFLKDTNCNVYTSLIPDKNYFLGEESGRLELDYEKLTDDFVSLVPNFEYIDIYPYLSIGDYYLTDTHWKQESITDVADALAQAMGTDISGEYQTNELEGEFKGVYYGQLALPVKTDKLVYLTNETLDNCVVYNHESGFPVEMEMYVSEKANGRDPYEMFLGGSLSYVSIENPNATADKELIIFRDSFGSAIAPLLAEGYSKIYVFDIRYLPSTAMLSNFVDFEDQDVLFLYSTLVLNNSETLKK